ncbi:MAG: hypothetical protein Q4D85_11675 [Corynebacterium sp.]|uniref:hypothetical protein n=1 Tax=Corynebacterium sp. TaxID=1720 RepID=UPI0026DC7907|nr:hypothetical protein [Corynebacterium sp.]MDO5099395.1 hypothetical protein [Corynebacterium sp.]
MALAPLVFSPQKQSWSSVKFFFKALFSVLSAFSLVFGSVNLAQAEDRQTSIEDRVQSVKLANVNVSDDDILKGILFGIGPVAKHIGFQVQMPKNLTFGQYETAVNKTINDLPSIYRHELRSVLMQLRSGDPVEVEQGMSDLSNIVVDYAAKKAPSYSMKRVRPACGVAVVCVAYAAAAVHNTVVVTGLVAVVVGGALWAGAWRWVGRRSHIQAASREALVVDVMEAVRDEKREI